MKKIILSLLLGLAISDIALANWGEINAKFGLDFPTKNKLCQDMSAYSGKGQSISLECLLHIPLLSFFKFGAGGEYLLPRKINEDYSKKFSALPIYLTAQINPFFGGLFIKGNFGRNIYSSIDKKFFKNVSGKYYYAVGIGHEFSFGLIVEFIYSIYEASDISYAKNTLNFGYKF
jgi:hypothetical protein